MSAPKDNKYHGDGTDYHICTGGRPDEIHRAPKDTNSEPSLSELLDELCLAAQHAHEDDKWQWQTERVKQAKARLRSHITKSLLAVIEAARPEDKATEVTLDPIDDLRTNYNFGYNAGIEDFYQAYKGKLEG